MAEETKLTGEHADVAKKMLRKVTDFLDDIGVGYVLSFGTLLGVVRENRLLPWDTDLDISIDYKDLYKLRENKRKIWKLGYRTRIRFFEKDVGPFKKGDARILKVQTRKLFLLKDKGLLDIFILRNIDKEYSYMVKKGKTYVQKVIPLEFQDNKTQLMFDGKLYSVPEKYEEYLEYVYGDWKKPVKEWDYFMGDNCTKRMYE